MSSTLIVEKWLPYSPARIWSALTDVKEMRAWYFNVTDFRPETGFDFEFDGGDDKTTYRHLCQVTQVDPGKRIAYTWKYKGEQGITEVIFDLKPKDNGTTVTVTHKDLDSLPQDNPAFQSANFKAGWEAIIGNELPSYLAKSSQAP